MTEKQNNSNFDKVNTAVHEMCNSLSLPGSLQKDNIAALLKNEKQKPLKRGQKVFKTIVSIAAVFAIIISAFGLNRNIIKPMITAEKLKQESQNTEKTEPFSFVGDLKSYSGYSSLLRAAARQADKNRFDAFTYGYNLSMKDTEDTASLPESAQINAAGLGNQNSGMSSEHGETNTQVNGVDEADIIKNDGQYIYYARLSESDNSIIIADCKNPNKITEAAEILFDCEKNEKVSINEIYITDNMLTVIANFYKTAEENDRITDYGYYTNTKTKVYFYDITNRSKPQLEREFSQDGYYTNSRLIGNNLVLWTNYNIQMSSAKSAMDTCIPETSNGRLASDRIAMADGFSSSYIIITSLDILNEDKSESVAINADGIESYCTSDTLYLACDSSSELKNLGEDFPYYNFEADNEKYMPNWYEYTKIYAFDITNGIKSTAAGKVIGTPLNQFSLDENGDYLRIATTARLDNNRNFLTVLSKQSLEKAGFIADIANGEMIKSARYIENTCYLVTFYQTDPLFVIDLSDPSNPVVKGELKIPGFSSYLHPISEKYLLGIGYGGTDDGLDGSVKLSLFDISDPEKPIEKSKAVIDNAWITDDSHKAFSYLGNNTYAVPLHINKLSTAGNEISLGTYLCILPFKITEGEITADAPVEIPGTGGYSQVRATYINDAVFVVSDYGIASYDRDYNRLDLMYFK